MRLRPAQAGDFFTQPPEQRRQFALSGAWSGRRSCLRGPAGRIGGAPVLRPRRAALLLGRRFSSGFGEWNSDEAVAVGPGSERPLIA
jgi:hypothetical protein